MEGKRRRERLGWWAAVGAIALAGLALRIAAARGGLWTDEAWSVVYAAQARDAAGVFLRINHDNNHHLYSLWLQAVGPAAPPLPLIAGSAPFAEVAGSPPSSSSSPPNTDSTDVWRWPSEETSSLKS